MCFKLKLILLLDKIVGHKYFYHILSDTLTYMYFFPYITENNNNNTIIFANVRKIFHRAFPHIAYIQMERGNGIFLFGFPLLQSNLKIAVQPTTIGDLRGRDILRTLFHPVFDEVGKHDNHFALLFPYHPPKVGDGRVHRCLASDVIFRRVLWPLERKSTRQKKIGIKSTKL